MNLFDSWMDCCASIRIAAIYGLFGYVAIVVSDQGSGIAAGHLAKIFDPYFTTKRPAPGWV